MIKCSSQQKLFLIKWILKSKEDLNSNLISKSKIPNIYFAFYGGMAYFLSFTTASTHNIEFPYYISRFWKDAINAWLILKHNVKIMHEKKEKMSLNISVFTEKDIPIFYNDNIKYRYNTLFHRKMIMANIRYLQDVLDREGAVRPMRDFPPQIRKEPDFMFIYSAIKTAIINSGKRNRLGDSMKN